MRSVRISSISVASYRSPALSGAICGWSPRMIGEESTTRVASRPSTGQVPTLRQRGDRRAAPTPAGRSSTGTARVERRTSCARRRARAAGRSSRSAGSSRPCGSRHVDGAAAAPRTGRAVRSPSATTAPPTGLRLAPCAVVAVVDRAVEGERVLLRRVAQLVDVGLDLDLALDGLVPFRQPATGAVLHVQEPQLRRSARRPARASQHDLGAARRPLGRVRRDVCRRHQHAELPAALVLRATTRGRGRARSPRRARRRRPARTPVERGHGTGHGAAPLRRAARSIVCSHVGSARAFLKAPSASSVSRLSRSQPLSGEEAVHHLPPLGHRQPAGGLLVPRHLGDAELRSSPRVNTVPLNSRTSGISPSSSAWK